jgi:hypothetical protein
LSSFRNLTDIVADPVEPVTVPLGEWLPDQAAVNNPGVLEALNVIPLDDGSYGPFPDFEPYGHGGMGGEALGAASVLIPNSNVVHQFVGQYDGVYNRLGDVTFSGLIGAPVSRNYNFQFFQFGTLMISLHRDSVPFKTVIGDTNPANTIALQGAVPRAACGAAVGDFVFLGNILDDPWDAHAVAPNRIRWSGIKNIDTWDSDPATQADYNDMPYEGGSVISVTGRTNLTVFQERMISVGRYVGLPKVWDIETAEHDVGCIARDSVVQMGQYTFFIAQDGFRVWNGTNSERIGDAKIDKYFFSKLQYAYREKISGVFDPVTSCVYWAFPTGFDGSLNELIIYNPRTNRFSHSIQTVECLVSVATSTITVDTLEGFTDDNLSYVDDPSFLTGGKPLLGVFSEGHLFGTFTGGTTTAIIDTAEFSGPENRRVFVNKVRPIIDITEPLVTVQAMGRDQLPADPLGSGAIVAQEADGTVPVLADGRYLRFRLRIPAGLAWKHAQGIEIYRKAGGRF